MSLEKAWGAELLVGGKVPSAASVAQGGWSFSCADVANAAISQIDGYRSRRTTFVRDLIGAAGEEIVNAISLPGQAFVDAATDRANARISVSILGTVWNAHNCGDRQVRAGPVLRTGTNVGGFGGWVLQCQDETWAISFDGGQTEYPITVRVCQYEPE